MNKTSSHELPAWLWLWLVPVLLIVQLIVRAISPEFANTHFSGELGIVENITVVILIPAIFLSLYLVANRRYLPARWMPFWYGMLGLACLYFAGEEASWGQHWFGWETPEGFKALNDQGETNFHNMSSWLDQKPRLIVELSAIIGGVILPIIRKRRGIVYPEGSWQALFWPTWICLPVSLFIGLIKLPDRLIGGQNIPYPFNLRVSETQEAYVAMAFFLYFASVAIRVYRQKKG
ncbi:hypothetical protein [Sneathiella chinensis]|uniref:Uncharacterized protein n=1 Tax=Sneathiella chinensis TaxID=349750 RepID=A0ABQ5U7L9_9PROT|nr:hypothetical protein [Sneathiella chinensis]GLQ07913.1 hypothetical protein GCM10007924_31350 [Sneathiella chinensis]